MEAGRKDSPVKSGRKKDPVEAGRKRSPAQAGETETVARRAVKPAPIRAVEEESSPGVAVINGVAMAVIVGRTAAVTVAVERHMKVRWT